MYLSKQTGKSWVISEVNTLRKILLYILINIFLTQSSFSDSTTFSYTGSVQNWTVPNGNTTITVTAYGGSGGDGANGTTVNGATGGNGAAVTATISVTAGDTLYLYVGGSGANASIRTGGSGGWGGGSSISSGGNGGTASSGYGAGGGGGGTLISTSSSLSDALIIAGGGGGGAGGANVAGSAGSGGSGGGNSSSSGISNGQSGSDGVFKGLGVEGAGGGAGTSSVGSGGGATDYGGQNFLSGSNGSGGSGGNGSNNTTMYSGGASGGGGGGYRGGGGGGESAAAAGAGGGGGSSFVIAGSSSITQTQGHASATGNGSITITYTSRLGYTVRITASSYEKILEILEQINTDGAKTTLIAALDDLSDISLKKVAKQIEGVTIKSINGQSFKKHSTFKRAVSSALATPSISSLTRNNYASLSLNDLNFNQSQNEYQMYSANSFDFKSMANIFKNKDLFSLKSKGSTLFFRTFGDQTNQDKIGTDTGFESSTAGFLLGNQNNLTDDIEQGWSFGYSTNDTDFDENYGNSEANTLHAMIYQNQQYDNFVLGLNLGTYVSRTDMDREITDGSVQTLKSRSYNYGFDITADIKQSYHLENNFTFTPSFSTNLSYIIQDDLDESGGDLALSVKNDNLLIVKPEIGFALEKNFNQTDQVSKSLGFSVYGSYEEKLDGTTSKAKIKDTGSNFDIVDENKNDTFVTTGLGYTFLDKIGNTEYNFGVFYTQNDNNNLNSTLASFNYNKKF
jgi:hypothetical protein